MEFGAHTIKPGTRTQKNKKRLGRGNASGRGNYSTRGMKGQRSRSGGKGGGQLRGFRQSLQKVPKLRGFKSQAVKPLTVTLAMLEHACEAGSAVTPFVLHERGVIENVNAGVKIVAKGTLTKKLQISNCKTSAGARAAIEKAGGTVA